VKARDARFILDPFDLHLALASQLQIEAEADIAGCGDFVASSDD
jgi:hypothetical protein